MTQRPSALRRTSTVAATGSSGGGVPVAHWVTTVPETWA
jgi:hypothetical protein